MVRVEDLDSHRARSTQHGAHIVMAPTTFEFGERQYARRTPTKRPVEERSTPRLACSSRQLDQ